MNSSRERNDPINFKRYKVIEDPDPSLKNEPDPKFSTALTRKIVLSLRPCLVEERYELETEPDSKF